MKKIIIFILILFYFSLVFGGDLKYSIILNDNTEKIAKILHNDSITKRLQIQTENDIRKEWISYHRIQAIIELESQKDMTDQFIRNTKAQTIKVQLQESAHSEAMIVVLSFVSLISLYLILKD